MSIERCEKHNWQWDSDFVGACPQCDWGDTEPAAQAGSPTRPDGQVGSTIDPSLPPASAAGHTHTADYDAHGCAYKEPAVDAFLFFNPVIDDDGPVESNLQEFIDFARSLEREAADLRRQLDEAKEDAREARGDASRAAMDAVRYAKELAAEREGRKAAFRQGVQLGKVEAERERDAALAQAAAVQEECAKACDPWDRQLARRIRSLTIAPEAGRNVAEDAARYRHCEQHGFPFISRARVIANGLPKWSCPNACGGVGLGNSPTEAIDAARKGEEGKHG